MRRCGSQQSEGIGSLLSPYGYGGPTPMAKLGSKCLPNSAPSHTWECSKLKEGGALSLSCSFKHTLIISLVITFQARFSLGWIGLELL